VVTPRAHARRYPRRVAEAPFVGRARERVELSQRWVPGALVTLLGPAGVGKSRLARRLDEPSTTVPLRRIDDDDRAWDTLALALGIAASADVRGAVASTLVRSPRRLVLDDADEVPPSFVAELARLADVPILVTSRRRLGLVEEVLVELGPLPDDEAAELLDAWLLRVRGRGANDAERPWLHTIARQLDGLPLAIELAAARTRVLGLAALSRRLDEHPSPVASARDRQRGGDRARGLDVAFEASWASLDLPERATLAQLTVFAGGFDVDSAEAVVRLESSAPPLLDVLQELRDRSLLQAEGARLDLLRTFSAFVRARSDDALVRAAEARHAEHFARLFEAPWDDAATLEARLAERENLLSALDRLRARHAPGSHEAETALRGLIGLAPLLLVRGPLHALASRLEPTLDRSARSGADLALLADASAVAARVHLRLGDPARAERALAEARLLMAKRAPGKQGADPSGVVARAGVELALARGADPSAWLEALPDDPSSELARAEALVSADPERARAAALRALHGDRLVRLAARVVLARLGDEATLRAAGELVEEAERLGDLASLARLHVVRDGAAGLARARRLAERLGDVRLWAELAPSDARVRLRVASDASVVEVDGEPVALGTRKSLRGVVRALVDAHGGAALPWDALLAAGWPGERVSGEAGMQRVRVAVSTLRKLGLAAAIETVEGGYRLDPRATVEPI
jgi:predicted ATPase